MASNELAAAIIPGSKAPSSSTPASQQQAQVNTDTKSTPVYFWKPDQGNGYLGQWYWSPFTHEDDTYKTAEMWMMVQKARLFGDEAVATKMLATTDPKRHKALGREVKGFQEEVWNARTLILPFASILCSSRFPSTGSDSDAGKMGIVTEGNMHKFTVSEDAENLRNMLLATGSRELVEASPLDRIWGVGFAERNAGSNRHRWGQNLLGKALMDVREKLRPDMA